MAKLDGLDAGIASGDVDKWGDRSIVSVVKRELDVQCQVVRGVGLPVADVSFCG